MAERIILDPSVIIAAALNSSGSTHHFLSAIDELEENVEIIWSQKLGYELHEKFHVDLPISTRIKPHAKEALSSWLEERADLVEDIKLDNPLPLAHDRDDDYLVALSIHYKAILITLDRRLISHCPPDVTMMRPDELLKQLSI